MIETTENRLRYVLDEEALTATIVKAIEKESSFVIPEKIAYNGATYRVTCIGEWAFNSCIALTAIEIPNSITNIEKRAFCNCDTLTSIIIPDSVTHIGEYAFFGCDNLASITLSKNITSIEERCFSHCYALTEFIIPKGTKNIGQEAFLLCDALTTITIPNSITNIDMWALGYCKSLINIHYDGTIEQWRKIKLGEYWNDGVPVKAIHCTDGNTKIYKHW